MDSYVGGVVWDEKGRAVCKKQSSNRVNIKRWVGSNKDFRIGGWWVCWQIRYTQGGRDKVVFHTNSILCLVLLCYSRYDQFIVVGTRSILHLFQIQISLCLRTGHYSVRDLFDLLHYIN